MENALNLREHIHQEAMAVARRYRKTEAELIDVLTKVDQHRVYLHSGSASLFHYVVQKLGLSESVAYNLIAVTRKSHEVPELKAKIEAGEISLTNARRIAPVLTVENQAEWLEKASSLSQRQLEKEIVRVRPIEATPERATYLTPTRVKLEVGLSENDMLQLRRSQDLLSQSRRRSVSLEEVIVAMTGEFLLRHDPVVKAKRIHVKKGLRGKNGAVTEVELTEVRKANTGEANAASEEVGQAVDLERAAATKADLTATNGPLSKSGSEKTLAPARQSSEPVSIQVSVHKREPIPAVILHRVRLRDEGKCTYVASDQKRCGQRRFLDVHHVLPVSQGGQNTFQNLVTLCRAHHQWMHLAEY